MNTIMKYLLLIYLCLSSVNSLATDYTNLSAYEIEVVIFKFTDSRLSGSEIWPDLVKSVPVEDSIELHNNNSITQIPGLDNKGYYYSKIEPENFRLSEEVGKLKASDDYKILYHAAWIQPGLDKDSAESIHIKYTESDYQAPAIDVLAPVSPAKELIVPSQAAINGTSGNYEKTILEGLIKVELSRYLHINFDLKYQRDLSPSQGIMNTSVADIYKDIKYYPVQLQRRMRSKEVHYIDHPLIGVLVLATPFELPVKEAPADRAGPLLKLGDVPVKK
ncbi:MAG: peptidoglycan binding protein CsiV [Gammaproteobacteria bacterium]|nr:peptidoglycan binding protein CsiV [Gammaproteobacteria bacterium]